ncbi:sigma-70 family RNA polymerase sigma factor [Gemmiger formicilis]|nr:sigma-70 family RNA polymerase sigma factor [Gemmiger formicilis]
MFSVLWVFLQQAAAHIWYAALHLESGSFPRPLSPAQEQAAFAAMAVGDKAARDRLISHNLRLVAHVVKKYYSTPSGQDDLISIGTIGLIKAVDTFRPERKVRFASYASQCIENAILSKTPVWEFRLEKQNGFSGLCQNGRSSPSSHQISTYSAAPTTASPASRPWLCTGSASSRHPTCPRPSVLPGSTKAMRRLAASPTGCGGAACIWACCSGRWPSGWALPRPFTST